jgi:cell division protein FtsW
MSTIASDTLHVTERLPDLPGPAAGNTRRAEPVRAEGVQAGSLADFDGWLMATTLALLAFGLLMVLSASVAKVADAPFYYLMRQAVAAAVGIGLAALVMRTPLVELQRAAGAFLLLSFVLALLVLAVGRTVNGSTRWLSIAGVSIQVSEPIKLFLVIWLASYLVRHRDPVRTELQGFLLPLGVAGAISMLILAERDLGGASVTFVTALGLLWAGGVPAWRFLLWLIPIAALFPMLVMMKSYRMLRLLAYLDPWADPQDTGYQLVNSLMAFGRGGWMGVGLGGSVQKLSYLPEVHTDFIFAVVGEELGVLGTLALIFAFGFLVWRILAIAEQCGRVGHGFAAYLCYGVALIIGLQAFINMGVALGLLPTKGLTLPLISYGSNSLIVTSLALGCVLRASSESARLLRLRPPATERRP